ncbi:MAG: transglutaminase-like domain-containing protein [Mycobacteriaceae bacterium]
MSSSLARREVFSQLDGYIFAPSHLVLQVAVSAHPGATVNEQLQITVNDKEVPFKEIDAGHRGRIHLVDAPAGLFTVKYSATVQGKAEPITATGIDPARYLRPSRYAESDRIATFAAHEFAGLTSPTKILAAVSSWVGSYLSYVLGSSGPTDSAIDTLLSRQGVCRDYAHLCVALLRAMDIPARLVAVYAPGLAPMDFHAVAEALIDGQWHVVDSTRLAPRATMVRIATGRDAADTAFLSNYGGALELHCTMVQAELSQSLPSDDANELIELT